MKRPSDPHKRHLLALDERYRLWLTFLPSCIDGMFSEIDDNGRPRSIACHIRRARNAGVAIKPLFSAVPMTNEQHQLQHAKGESALRTPEWFTFKAEEYLDRWLRLIDRPSADIVREFMGMNAATAH